MAHAHDHDSRKFIPVRVAVLTVSDTRTEDNDTSGGLIIERLETKGHEVVTRRIVPDDLETIRSQVEQWAEDDGVEVVISTGGTGLTKRDITPEALEPLITKPIPGFGELFRQISYEEIGTSTIQSRALGALIGDTLVFALPGSTGACRTAMDKILDQQLDYRHKPCNFVEMLPRIRG